MQGQPLLLHCNAHPDLHSGRGGIIRRMQGQPLLLHCNAHPDLHSGRGGIIRRMQGQLLLLHCNAHPDLHSGRGGIIRRRDTTHSCCTAMRALTCTQEAAEGLSVSDVTLSPHHQGAASPAALQGVLT